MDGIHVLKELFYKSILEGNKTKDLFGITHNFIEHNIKWKTVLACVLMELELWLASMMDFRF